MQMVLTPYDQSGGGCGWAGLCSTGHQGIHGAPLGFSSGSCWRRRQLPPDCCICFLRLVNPSHLSQISTINSLIPVEYFLCTNTRSSLWASNVE